MEGSLWWKDILELLPEFKASASCKLGEGSTIPFWHDKWLDDPLIHKYPELHSFAMDDSKSLAMVRSSGDITDLFHRPLSWQAYG